MNVMSSDKIDRTAIDAIEIHTPAEALAARNWQKFAEASRSGMRFQQTLERMHPDISRSNDNHYMESLAVQLLAMGHTPQEASDVLVAQRDLWKLERQDKAYYVALLVEAAERVESQRKDARRAELIDAEIRWWQGVARDIVSVVDAPLRDKVDGAIYGLQKNGDLYTVDGKASVIYAGNNGLACIETLTPDRMMMELTRAVNFIRPGKTKTTQVSPPADVVKGTLAHPALPFRKLDGLAHAPYLRKDGTLCNTPGYDAKSHVFLDGSLPFNADDIDQPSQGSAQDAYRWLEREVFGEFPIVSGRPYLVAAMLAGVCMGLIDGPTPMIGITASKRNSGKTLIAGVLGTVLTGQETVTSAPASEEEWRKQMLSLLREGASVVCFDNIRGTLGSPALEAILTSRHYRGRILGVSEDATVTNRAVWLATGNNLTLGGDMGRRVLMVTLREHKHTGAYRHPQLLSWAREHRSEILGGLFTIALSWIAAGKPQPVGLPCMGGYENWQAVIGGMLQYAGASSFLKDFDADGTGIEDEQWHSFVEGLHLLRKQGVLTYDEDGWFTAADVKALIKPNTQNPFLDKPQAERLVASLPDELADALDRTSFSARLGRALKAHVGTTHDGLSLAQRLNTHTHTMEFKVAMTFERAQREEQEKEAEEERMRKGALEAEEKERRREAAKKQKYAWNGVQIG